MGEAERAAFADAPLERRRAAATRWVFGRGLVPHLQPRWARLTPPQRQRRWFANGLRSSPPAAPKLFCSLASPSASRQQFLRALIFEAALLSSGNVCLPLQPHATY